jgi:hypothetical protein
VRSHIHIQRELVILNYLGKFYVSLNFYVYVVKNQAVQLKMSDVSTMSKKHKVLVSKDSRAIQHLLWNGSISLPGVPCLKTEMQTEYKPQSVEQK